MLTHLAAVRDFNKCCRICRSARAHRGLLEHFAIKLSAGQFDGAQALSGPSPSRRAIHKKIRPKDVLWMARREGLEPPTDRFEVCDSIH